jgi:hypothetical protein
MLLAYSLMLQLDLLMDTVLVLVPKLESLQDVSMVVAQLESKVS